MGKKGGYQPRVVEGLEFESPGMTGRANAGDAPIAQGLPDSGTSAEALSNGGRLSECRDARKMSPDVWRCYVHFLANLIVRAETRRSAGGC